ncbi:unnamed protein product, partial [Amoebophrya sp. A25]|eukprot:GSA25T00016704001.1
MFRRFRERVFSGRPNKAESDATLAPPSPTEAVEFEIGVEDWSLPLYDETFMQAEGPARTEKS